MNIEFKGTKEQVYADVRNGCVAIYPISRQNEKNGISQEDDRNIFYSDKGAEFNGNHWIMDEETQDNAELFANAINTIQQCNLLPSELLKQNKEMRELLENLKDEVDWTYNTWNGTKGAYYKYKIEQFLTPKN